MNCSGTTFLLILVMGLAALVVALGTVILKMSVGTPVVEATLSAGPAFAVAFGLGLGILGALSRKI